MTKSILVTAALVAAVAYSAQASAAGGNAASRRAQAATTMSRAGDCVRAPNVGSYATAPFKEPPCMPGTMR